MPSRNWWRRRAIAEANHKTLISMLQNAESIMNGTNNYYGYNLEFNNTIPTSPESTTPEQSRSAEHGGLLRAVACSASPDARQSCAIL